MKSLFNGVFANKKVLVTGDTGFKGSWLSIWLHELGAEVYGYSLDPKSPNDNYVTSQLDKKIYHKTGDIRDFKMLSDYMIQVQPEIAFHLAAQPLVIESYNDPRYTFETNVNGAVNFFESCRVCESLKVAVNITSDKCYRNNNWVWGYRESDPMGGKDPYSASKSCSELITDSYYHSFFKDSGCNIASARAGNVIGAGDWAENRIVPDYYRALIKGHELLLRNPHSTRPWQHVLEPLSGYLLLAAKLYTDNSYCGGWNFGPAYEMNYSVKELVEELNRNAKGAAITHSVTQSTISEAEILKLDISKALFKLGWKPALDFHQTCQFTNSGYLNDIHLRTDCYSNRVQTITDYVSRLSFR